MLYSCLPSSHLSRVILPTYVVQCVRPITLTEHVISHRRACTLLIVQDSAVILSHWQIIIASFLTHVPFRFHFFPLLTSCGHDSDPQIYCSFQASFIRDFSAASTTTVCMYNSSSISVIPPSTANTQPVQIHLPPYTVIAAVPPVPPPVLHSHLPP